MLYDCTLMEKKKINKKINKTDAKSLEKMKANLY